MVTSSAFRLAAVAVALFLLLSGLLVGLLFWQTNEVLTEQVAATLAAEVEALDREAKAGPQSLLDAVAARSRPEGPGLYVLADATGRKLAGNLSRVPPELDGQLRGAFRYRPRPSEPERLAVATLKATADGGKLVVGRDVDDQRRLADSFKRLFLMTFVALTLLGILTAALISRLVLKRIEAMNATAREIMAGDLSRRVPLAGSGDELDGLGSNLNAMLDRIEQLMAGLREVSDNIAHDLKTPLNRLRNRVEGALREEEPAAHRAALVRTIEEADELIKTFNALLLIARLEAAAVDESAVAVDIGALVRDVAELYQPVAEEAGLRLDVTAGDGPVTMANRQLIGQAVANLVDNAIKYAPVVKYKPAVRPDGTNIQRSTEPDISVRIEPSPTSVEIIVADRGPGIAEADRERALRRFVRLEASRSEPGTGLGLSLVAAVARMHGGRVTLDDNRPGLVVRLTLPLRRPTVSSSAVSTTMPAAEAALVRSPPAATGGAR